MIKKLFYLPVLLLLSFSFSSCEFKTTETVSVGKTINADYKTTREGFIEELSRLGNFENVGVSTSVFEQDGEETHSITIDITNPESAPETPIQLKGQAKEIESIARENIRNIESFDKFVVNYTQQKIENGIEKKITFKIETEI